MAAPECEWMAACEREQRLRSPAIVAAATEPAVAVVASDASGRVLVPWLDLVVPWSCVGSVGDGEVSARYVRRNSGTDHCELDVTRNQM